MLLKARPFLFVLFFATYLQGYSQTLVNPQELFQRFKLESYLIKSGRSYSLPAELSNIKIALFDDGFLGYQKGDKRLPPKTQLIQPKGNPALAESHGYIMAQVLWATMGGKFSQNNTDGPTLYLLHTNGLDNLEQAINFVIQNKVDIVVQSKVSDWGSNFDGTGLINKNINRAINAGIIFINAAGNLHNSVYFQRNIRSIKNKDGLDYVELPGPANTLNFTNKARGNLLDISLAWSDFGRDRNYASSKDLDLYLYKKNNSSPMAKSEKDQIGILRPKQHPNSPINALAIERIVLELDPGEYSLKIINRNATFEPNDSLRVIVDARNREALGFREAQGAYEIAAPADNPHVITVGALDETSSIGPTSDGRIKPDVILQNTSVRLFLNKGETVETKGSSTATAIFGATVALMKTQHQVSTESLKKYLERLAQSFPTHKKIPLWRNPKL